MNISKSVYASSIEKDKIIADYRDYIRRLDTSDFDSIYKAIDKFYELKSEDKSVNDNLYRYFYNIYNDVIKKYNNSITSEDQVGALDKSMLEKNGLIAVGGEAGTYLYEKSFFIDSKFGDYVSDEIKQFLDLYAEACQMRGEGYMFEDGYLTLTWNQVADLIVKYEDYVYKYPQYDIETDTAFYNLDYYLYLFTQCLDTITFSYMSADDGNEYELRDSYTYFIGTYTESRYQPVLKGYFEILKENGFILDEEARQYLIKNGIQVKK